MFPFMERISLERLRKALRYDPATGFFYRRTKAGHKRAGTVAHGYRYIYLQGKRYAEHHLAWFYVYGTWVDEIDHINRIKGDNSIANLRPATRSQNNANAKARGRLNTKGVSASYSKFRAHITINGKFHYLGTFDTIEDAKETYRKAAIAAFGEFASD